MNSFEIFYFLFYATHITDVIQKNINSSWIFLLYFYYLHDKP